VGTYTYHASKKHALIAAGSDTYDYDANGHVTKRNGSIVRWTSYNLPSMINMGNFYAAFTYAPDRRRLRQVSPYATGKEITIYVGEQMEKLSTPVRTHWKHRLPTPSGEVQVIRRSDGRTETLYLASDHLGSVDAVLNATGAVLARPSFNAWGGRRGSSWQGSPSQSEWQAIADTTRRGYTGHEQLDNVMLVHMNGRVYDPVIGRFLSADPFIDCAESTQGWNRYSYVKNSPLAFTDPSGYSSRGISIQPRVYRVDFGGSAIETITVTASRLDWWSRLELALSQRTSQGGGGRTSGDLGGGGGGQSGGDGAKQQEEERQKCVEDCIKIGNAAASIAGSTTAGSIAGYQVGGPYGAIVGGVAGTIAGGVMAQSGHNGNQVAIATAAGGAGGIVPSVLARGAATQTLGQVAGGMYAGMASAAGMPTVISSMSGGLISGIGEPGSAIARNLRVGATRGGLAGLAGLSVELLIHTGAEAVCSSICER